MESTIIEHFRASMGYDLKLLEYTAITYVACTNDMIKLMIDRGIEIVFSILTKVKNSYGPLVSPS